MSLALMIALIVFLTTGGVLLGIGLHGADELIRRRTPDVRTDPADYGLAYENVEFAACDGICLRGWFIPTDVTRTARGTVIFCHGHAGRCLLYTSPSPRDLSTTRMPSYA